MSNVNTVLTFPHFSLIRRNEPLLEPHASLLLLLEKSLELSNEVDMLTIHAWKS